MDITPLHPFAVFIEGFVDVPKLCASVTMQIVFGPFNSRGTADAWGKTYAEACGILKSGEVPDQRYPEAYAIRETLDPFLDSACVSVDVKEVDGAWRKSHLLIPVEDPVRAAGFHPAHLLESARRLIEEIQQELETDEA